MIMFERVNLPCRCALSFFDLLFNEVKSINEINSEFPQIKIDKRKTGYWEEERKYRIIRCRDRQERYYSEPETSRFFYKRLKNNYE